MRSTVARVGKGVYHGQGSSLKRPKRSGLRGLRYHVLKSLIRGTELGLAESIGIYEEPFIRRLDILNVPEPWRTLRQRPSILEATALEDGEIATRSCHDDDPVADLFGSMPLSHLPRDLLIQVMACRDAMLVFRARRRYCLAKLRGELKPAFRQKKYQDALDDYASYLQMCRDRGEMSVTRFQDKVNTLLSSIFGWEIMADQLKRDSQRIASLLSKGVRTGGLLEAVKAAEPLLVANGITSSPVDNAVIRSSSASTDVHVLRTSNDRLQLARKLDQRAPYGFRFFRKATSFTEALSGETQRDNQIRASILAEMEGYQVAQQQLTASFARRNSPRS